MSKGKLQNEYENEYKEITLLKNPIITLTYLVKFLSEQFVKFINFLFSHKITLLFAIAYLFLNFFPGPIKEVIFF